MIRLVKEPLLHFFGLGILLFATYGLLGGKGAERPAAIVVSAAQIANLRTGFARTWQRPPTTQELDGLIEDHVRGEVYEREARALRLDRDDTVIRRRLRQKMEFVVEDMGASTPTDAELGTYLAAHSNQFRQEDTVTFRHVFLKMRHDEGEIRKIGEALASAKNNDDTVLGDAFLLGDSFRAVSKSDVARTFGEGFAQELFTLSSGRWQGPIPSGYGMHFVFIDAHIPGTLPPLEAVRAVVEREWTNERRVKKLEDFYRALRQRYQITVEKMPVANPPTRTAGATP